MNASDAVDAMERMAALGRRLAAREQRLQRPPAALQHSPLWQQLFQDPLAALETTLALPAAAPQPQATAPHRPAPAWGRSLPAQESGSAQEPAVASRWSVADNPPAAAAGAFGHLARQPELLPEEGVRLAGRHSSLLNILNANLRSSPARGREPQMVEQRQVGAPTDPPPDRKAGQEEQHGGAGMVRRNPPGGRQASWGATVGDLGGYGAVHPSLPQVREATGLEGSLTRLHEAEDQAQGRDESHSARSRADFITIQESKGPEDGLPVEGSREEAGLHPRLGETVHHKEARADLQHGIWAGDGEKMVLAAPAQATNGWEQSSGDSAWKAVSDPNGVERPLTDAQIEQVLAALDERLDLLLLRMYGASGVR